MTLPENISDNTISLVPSISELFEEMQSIEIPEQTKSCELIEMVAHDMALIDWRELQAIQQLRDHQASQDREYER